MTERPGKWKIAHSPSGTHLVLFGANGEKVLVSEVYDGDASGRGAVNALDLVARTPIPTPAQIEHYVMPKFREPFPVQGVDDVDDFSPEVPD